MLATVSVSNIYVTDNNELKLACGKDYLKAERKTDERVMKVELRVFKSLKTLIAFQVLLQVFLVLLQMHHLLIVCQLLIKHQLVATVIV